MKRKKDTAGDEQPLVVPQTSFDLTGGQFFSAKRGSRLRTVSYIAAAIVVAVPTGFGTFQLLATQDARDQAAELETATEEGYETLAEMTGLGNVVPEDLDAHRRNRVGYAESALDSQLDYTKIFADIEQITPDGIAINGIVVTSSAAEGSAGLVRLTGTAESIQAEQVWEAALTELDYITDAATTYSGASASEGRTLTFSTSGTLTSDARSDRLERIKDRLGLNGDGQTPTGDDEDGEPADSDADTPTPEEMLEQEATQ